MIDYILKPKFEIILTGARPILKVFSLNTFITRTCRAAFQTYQMITKTTYRRWKVNICYEIITFKMNNYLPKQVPKLFK